MSVLVLVLILRVMIDDDNDILLCGLLAAFFLGFFLSWLDFWPFLIFLS